VRARTAGRARGEVVRAARLTLSTVVIAVLVATVARLADGEPAARAAPSVASTPGAASAPATAAPATAAPTPTERQEASRRPATELPRGGRTLFPTYRLVGFSGGPGSAAFGRLGVGRMADRVAEMERLGTRYARGRRPMPVLELVTVVAQPRPGRDGLYRVRVDDAVIARYLAAARSARGLLLLDVQPGRARFVDEVRALDRWLREPDVGVALDPEWSVRGRGVPGEVLGSTTGAEVDAVSRYLDGVVRQGRLPQKVLVVHQLTPSVLTGAERLRERPGVAVVRSVDGIGSPAAKTATWRQVSSGPPSWVHGGFKLFFAEDARHGPLMTPTQVLALRPEPDYVLYE